jgi:P27 family predicted phage terminase small subunit
MPHGPKPKSLALKALEGNPSKESLKPNGIEALGEPFVPEHLMDDARGCIEAIKQSMPVRVYSALDTYLLSAFGMAWAMHKMAAHKVSAPDFEAVYQTCNGSWAQNPWLKIMSEQAQLVASLGDRLGLDPRSRTALKLPDARQKRSKFAGLIGQSGSSSLSSVLPFPPVSAKAAPSG